MQIIPSIPYNNDSNAEQKVFRQLQKSFVSDNSYIVFHSLNLTRHETKRFGEADFVLLNSHGLFVLEVKGGGVSYTDGRWETINKSGQHIAIQDPFRQAEDAMHGIARVVKQSGEFPHVNLPIGFGVIFPDIHWGQKSSEWERVTVCDKEDLNNFEKWLSKLFRYWQSKPHNNQELDSKQLNCLKTFLRPEFEIIEPLYSVLDGIHTHAVRLTEDQYRYLDFATANKRVLCHGGAGTGKTFLAAELARRAGREDKQILFLCKSNWLRQYLSTRINNQYVTLSTICSVKTDKTRKRIDKFDVLIVDEGQDLFNWDDIEIIESLVKGGLQGGEWYIFHDVNNQSGLFAESDKGQAEEVLSYLEDYAPIKMPLTTNCRNTVNILDSIKSSLGLDMGNIGTGNGPQTREQAALSEDKGKALDKEIKMLLNQGAKESSITILSPLPYHQSSVALLTEATKRLIQELDDYSVRSFPPRKISFSQIKNFKGLENEVVIVIDLPAPKKLHDAPEKTQHYVAMSRARGLLCTIWVSSKES
jgi:hypothetical protein